MSGVLSPGKLIIGIGLVVLAAGLLVEFAPGLRLGRLPGDLNFGSTNARVFIPLGTSLLLSVVLSLVFALLARR